LVAGFAGDFAGVFEVELEDEEPELFFCAGFASTGSLFFWRGAAVAAAVQGPASKSPRATANAGRGQCEIRREPGKHLLWKKLKLVWTLMA
jgi:hypothetical protein